MWVWMSVLSALLLGFYDVAKKQALRKNGVLEVLAVSSGLTALFLAPFLSAGSLQDHIHIIVKATVVTASWVSGLAAVKLIPLTTASTLKATRPVIVVVMSLVIFGERLNPGQWAAVVLVLGSLFYLGRTSRSEGVGFTSNRGVLYMLISILTGASSALWDKHILKGLDPLFVQSWSNVYITALLILILFGKAIAARRSDAPESASPRIVTDWNLLLIAVLITAADALYFFALKQEGSMVSVVSLIRRASVIVPFFAGIILYKEKNIRKKALTLSVLMAGIVLLVFTS